MKKIVSKNSNSSYSKNKQKNILDGLNKKYSIAPLKKLIQDDDDNGGNNISEPESKASSIDLYRDFTIDPYANLFCHDLDTPRLSDN